MKLWAQNNPNGAEMLGAFLIALFFMLGDYYASRVEGGYTIARSVETVRDMSASVQEGTP
jgi:hypothetical protein